ncbi:MAG: hypothetical protein ACREB2_03615 [Pseudolabrys sp.]
MAGVRSILSLAAAGLLGQLLLAEAPAQAAGWLEKGIYLTGPNYEGRLPPCEAALGKIAARFAQKEGQYWNSDLQILDFEKVREIAFRPWAAGTIPRRFCSAVAVVSDGRKHRVNYWIGEDTGMIGAYWGVEWCVVGLDRNWAYNPACKMARP